MDVDRLTYMKDISTLVYAIWGRYRRHLEHTGVIVPLISAPRGSCALVPISAGVNCISEPMQNAVKASKSMPCDVSLWTNVPHLRHYEPFKQQPFVNEYRWGHLQFESRKTACFRLGLILWPLRPPQNVNTQSLSSLKPSWLDTVMLRCVFNQLCSLFTGIVLGRCSRGLRAIVPADSK